MLALQPPPGRALRVVREEEVQHKEACGGVAKSRHTGVAAPLQKLDASGNVTCQRGCKESVELVQRSLPATATEMMRCPNMHEREIKVIARWDVARTHGDLLAWSRYSDTSGCTSKVSKKLAVNRRGRALVPAYMHH